MLKLLLERYGYISDEEINEMINIFGEDFVVIVKDEFGDRYPTRLIDLENFEEEKQVFIREVFLRSQDYRVLEEAMTNYNDTKYIASLVKTNNKVFI